MTDAYPSDSEIVRQRAAAALAQFVGDDKAVTRDMLVRLSAHEPRTVKAHVLGETTPTLSAFVTYCRLLPVEYAASVLALAGLTGLRKTGHAIQPAEALAELAEGVSALAEAMADGRIDHRERPVVVRELRQAIAAAEALVADLEGSAR